MRPELGVAVLALWGAVLMAAPAPAQTTSDRVAAEALFSDGRRLMDAGEYEAACQKFDASRKLEPALGATLNLAACYEKLGRIASAWAEFKGAAAEARRQGDAERHAAALERAAALEPKLSRVRITAEDPAVSVFRNGESVSAAVLASAIPLDPGSHRLEARAPGRQTWVKSIEVGADGTTLEVRIPRLKELPAPPPPSGSAGTQRTLAWVSGGVGALGLATGVTFGVLAAVSWSDAKNSCADFPFECTGKSQQETAETQATIATIASITGGVGLALGAVLLLTDEDEPSSTQLVLGPANVALRGRF